ncbi:Mmp37-domain-containing protein [Ceraceosorus guamensis]|uniref:Phosphatidate cytidylyltransferase, mitochondrial n=1 Tax=Ceraceosorus guamensis TaxID=1522189 RepID=A0A316VUI7_9BASI|nr:Mmp37-domain-containing protein [Ceraceosorus guamensis]PWN41247.1 Mmp37-domain-containing protein [Ceraceosorus guamensis]
MIIGTSERIAGVTRGLGVARAQSEDKVPLAFSARSPSWYERSARMGRARPSQGATLHTSAKCRRDLGSSGTGTTRRSAPQAPPAGLRTTSFPPPSFPEAFGANQMIPLSSDLNRRLSNIHSSFRAPIRFAFAYGSGVFKQSDAGPEHSKRPQGPKGKMIDVVMAVAHPEHWHSVNMKQHPRHYPTLARLLGGTAAAKAQKWGAGLWYNPYVKIGDELIKYGVISVDDLCNDLLDWDTLYVSGRMHKPVAMLQADARVRLAQQVNLTSALRVALLLLPERFTEVELYTQIASLSYTGDFRMSVPGGENADKVRNIVLGQRDQFRRLYAGLVRSFGTVHIEETRADRFAMIQDTSAATRADYAGRLPLRLREKVQAHYTAHPDADPAFLALSLSRRSDQVTRKPSAVSRNSDDADAEKERRKAFWKAAVEQKDFERVLLQMIAKTVKGPAWAQSVKGVYTAGFGRSLRYVLAKVGKVSVGSLHACYMGWGLSEAESATFCCD